jgi:hypothetical protein
MVRLMFSKHASLVHFPGQLLAAVALGVHGSARFHFYSIVLHCSSFQRLTCYLLFLIEGKIDTPVGRLHPRGLVLFEPVEICAARRMV